MITVRFQIPGKIEDIAVPVVPRIKEIVKIWGARYEVMDIIHELVSIKKVDTTKAIVFEEIWIIWVSLYPA